MAEVRTFTVRGDDVQEAIIVFCKEKVMTSKQRTVYELIHDTGMTQIQAAEKLEVSQATVNRHYKAADKVIMEYTNCMAYVLNSCRIQNNKNNSGYLDSALNG